MQTKSKLICKQCEIKENNTYAGSKNTRYKCERCGLEVMHENTYTPRLCPICARQGNVCTRCVRGL